MIYTTENIAELKVDLLEGEDHGMLKTEDVTRNEHLEPLKEPETGGRHTDRKKKISPRRIPPSSLPDGKEVTNAQPKTERKKRTEDKTDDPEYVPDTLVQPVSSENRRLSERIKQRDTNAPKLIIEKKKSPKEKLAKVDEDNIPLAHLGAMDEDNIPLAHLRNVGKDADNLLYQKHHLKLCSVEMPKLQVKMKAELKDPMAWFENLETQFQLKSQEDVMNFDEDDNELQVYTDCNFCGYKSQTLNEHLDHIRIHSRFTCNICTSPCLDEEDLTNHMVENHKCNVMDR